MKRLLGILILLVQTSVLVHGQSSSISGQILGIDGKPAANVRVAAASIDENGNVAASSLAAITPTDDSGHYRLDMPVGRFGILAGTLAMPTYYPGTSSASDAKIITIAQGSSIDGMDFELQTLAAPLKSVEAVQAELIRTKVLERVTGKIVIDGQDHADGAPNILRLAYSSSVPFDTVMNAVAPLTASEKEAQFVTMRLKGNDIPILPDGSFQFFVFPGDYAISAARWLNFRPNDDYYVRAISAGTADLLHDSVKVTGAVTDEIVVSLGISAPIIGNLRTERGEVAVDVEIYLVPSSAPIGRQTLAPSGVTDRLGNFRIRAVPPGAYIISSNGFLDGRRAKPSIAVTGNSLPAMNLVLQDSREIIWADIPIQSPKN